MEAKGCIIIHVDALRREFCYCRILRAIFENEGFKTLLVSRRNIKKVLKVISPEALILSHVNTLDRNMLQSLSRKTDIYVVTVEAVGNETYQYKVDFPESTDYSYFKGIFVWNDTYRLWLINNRNIAAEKVFAFGSPKLTMTKYIEDVETKAVGLVGRFEFLNDFAGRPSLAALLRMRDKDNHFKYRFFAEIEGAALYGALIRHLIAKGKTISIRPHPNEDPETYNILKAKYGDSIIIDNGIDFIEWISTVNVIVGTVSTALTEAYILGKPIISVDSIFDGQNYMVRYDSEMMPLISATYAPKTFDELVKLVNSESLNALKSAEMDSFLKRHYNIAIDENKGFNALFGVAREVISHRSSRCPWMLSKFVGGYYLLIDIWSLLAILKPQRRSLQKCYNYSPFLHRPSQLMLRMQANVLKNWKNGKGYDY